MRLCVLRMAAHFDEQSLCGGYVPARPSRLVPPTAAAARHHADREAALVQTADDANATDPQSSTPSSPSV